MNEVKIPEEFFEHSHSFKEITEYLNISHVTLRKWLKELNLPPHAKVYKPNEVKKIFDLLY